MSKQQRHTILYVLVSIILTLTFIEGSLRTFDSWKAGKLADDMRIISMGYDTDVRRGYVLSPGHYQFADWQATILPDVTRLVPDTNLSVSCQLVLLGDSVTFGLDLNDSDTWANLLARQLPDVQIVNTGVNGYSIDNVLWTRPLYRADAYLYLLIGNDIEYPAVIHRGNGERLS